MQIMERITEAEQQAFEAIQETQQWVVSSAGTSRKLFNDSIDAGRKVYGDAWTQAPKPEFRSISMPDLDFPTITEIVDNVTDFGVKVLEANRAFVKELQKAMVPEQTESTDEA